MKVGIVTIMDDTNFGNRLQNYAVCYYLQNRMACNVETITSIKTKPFENHHYDIWLKNQLVRAMYTFPKLAEKEFGPKMTRRINFKKWSARIPTKYFYENSGLPDELNRDYDLFFVGSDQVWNCNFPAFKEYDYFLKFADNARKASISASFGFESVPNDKRRLYQEELNKFRFLSVRETAGQDIIKDLTGKDVPVLVDPVMMLDEKEWMKVSEKPRVDIDRKYILKYYLGDKDQKDPVAEWAKDNGYTVYEMLDQKNADLYSAGPGEFLSLIRHASLICSDSFHCITFSILFKKPFIVYSRKGEENYMTSRLDTLLGKFGFENRWSDRLSEDEYLDCDYTDFEQKLGKERSVYDAYIRKVLSARESDKDRPKLADTEKCTGCSACASICPRHCIQMIKDRNGFSFPEIMDSKECVHCRQCEKICPVLNRKELSHIPTAYAAYSKNCRLREQSSSGGVFSEIAEYIISNNGIVFGAAYDEHFNVHHIAVESKQELEKLRGAKYAESCLDGIFPRVLQELQSGRLVLFSGTPCQAAGLKSYLRTDYRNLYCIDFVCHGIPSPMVWSEYIRYRAETDNSGKYPVAVNLRSKDSGWSRYSYSIEFSYEDHVFSTVSSQNDYMNLFVSDYINRASCSKCFFKGCSRISDFTIGDFWGIWDIEPDMDDNRGTSVVLVQSEKAVDLFSSISARLKLKVVSLNDASRQNPSMIKASDARQSRETILEMIRVKGFKAYKIEGRKRN